MSVLIWIQTVWHFENSRENNFGSNLGLRELIQSAVSSVAVNNRGHKVDALTSQIMFCAIVITFANSLDTDQDRQNVLIWIQNV